MATRNPERLDDTCGPVSMGRSPTFPFAQWRGWDEHRTVYFDEGRGPALVFVHGLGGNVTHWEFVARELARDHRVIGLDLVGFGATRKPWVDYTVDMLRDHLLEFLASRGIRRATLLGHSMGGTVCLAAALARPDLVEGLVLVGAAGLGPLPGWMKVAGALMLRRRPLFHALLHVHGFILDNVFVDRPEVNPYVRHFRGASLQDAPGFPHLRDFARVSCSICRDILGRDYSPHLPELSMPVLAIWGEADRLVAFPSVKAALTRIPRLRAFGMAQTGHMPMIERPPLVTGMVRDFLAEEVYAGAGTGSDAGGGRGRGTGPRTAEAGLAGLHRTRLAQERTLPA
ncbi:MAG: alpha/beta fold hydrolase [Deltaproteobacteria bacterium]|nr:alpha/beta fold hydrolase [Deltaproteobacteria bacterium]